MFFYSTSSKIYNIIYPSVYQLRFPFFLCNHSFYPMSSINHPKNRGAKRCFFALVLLQNRPQPTICCAKPYYFSFEPQYIIRIILSTCVVITIGIQFVDLVISMGTQFRRLFSILFMFFTFIFPWCFKFTSI